MTDKSKEVEVKTVTQGPPWLEEVKRDAERITAKRIKDVEEEKAYQEEKASK